MAWLFQAPLEVTSGFEASLHSLASTSLPAQCWVGPSPQNQVHLSPNTLDCAQGPPSSPVLRAATLAPQDKG